MAAELDAHDGFEMAKKNNMPYTDVTMRKTGKTGRARFD